MLRNDGEEMLRMFQSLEWVVVRYEKDDTYGGVENGRHYFVLWNLVVVVNT